MRNTNLIKNIIFDFGGVLIDWDPYPVMLKSFNNNPEKTRWFLDNICDYAWNNELDKGKSFAEAKKEKTAEYPQYQKYIADYHDKWEDMLLGEISETVEILHSIKKSNHFHLFAITNWSAEKFPIAWTKFQWLKYFEDIIVSGEVRMVKPDKKIYTYALKRFHLSNPSESVFIDDRIQNIEVAESFGIKGLHFENAVKLKEDLFRLGII